MSLRGALAIFSLAFCVGVVLRDLHTVPCVACTKPTVVVRPMARVTRDTPPPASSTTDWIDALVLHGRDASTPVNFVQIGANDGAMHDPLHPLIASQMDRMWRGVLVEPTPWAMARLRRTYAALRGAFTFVEAAVATACDNGTVDLYEARPANMTAYMTSEPHWTTGISTLGVPPGRRASDYTRTRVPCVTMAELAAWHMRGLERVDLLLVDTEGFDWPLVSQWVAWPAQQRPAAVVWEAWQATKEQMNKALDAVLFFTHRGFNVSKTGERDLVAWL